MSIERRALLILAGSAMSAGAAPAADATVAIDNFTFAPQALSIPAGTRVVWTNRDDVPHSIVSEASPPVFRSRALDSGEGYGFVFARPGRYAYFCGLHPHMRAVVVVT